MIQDVAGVDTCELCRTPIPTGHACHLYEDGTAISLCGTQCAQDYLMGARATGEVAHGEDLLTDTVAERRWRFGGR